jgi:hypothetical protein
MAGVIHQHRLGKRAPDVDADAIGARWKIPVSHRSAAAVPGAAINAFHVHEASSSRIAAS